MLDSPKELLKKLLYLTPIIPIQSKSLAGAVGFKNQYIKKKKKLPRKFQCKVKFENQRFRLCPIQNQLLSY